MCNMQELSLSSNNISDPGLAALADVLGKGALAKCTYISLAGNQIGDAGLSAFAGALSSGALDHLTVRWRPTALFPCLETPHVHSPDSEHLFDVPYAVP